MIILASIELLQFGDKQRVYIYAHSLLRVL